MRCHPKACFPEGWDIWHSDNHWSNEETMKRYIVNVIVPFVMQKRATLNLGRSHPALALFDGFRGQTTDAMLEILEDSKIRYVLIPPNCTDKLQPLDIAVNKPMKNGLKAKFQSWYANEVQKQLKIVALNNVKVDTTLTVVKSPSASWIVSTWQDITRRPEIAIGGFRHAGISNAIAAVRN